MRGKLNPDGPKIKILRIQRGWTQEQLAEIAGVSARTIQRAETASSASFETLRAIAVAFETDFAQLLGSESSPDSDHEAQVAEGAVIMTSGQELETIPVNPTRQWVRPVWTRSFLSVCTLILGLAAGAILTTHFGIRGKSHSLESSKPAVVSRAVEIPPNTVPLIADARLEKPAAKVRTQPVNAAASKHPVSLRQSIPEEPQPVVSSDAGSREMIQSSQASAFFDSLPHSHTLQSELVMAEMPVRSSELPVLAINRPQDEPELGAVRQALDLAARKTGSFVSKVGTSVKRVF